MSEPRRLRPEDPMYYTILNDVMDSMIDHAVAPIREKVEMLEKEKIGWDDPIPESSDSQRVPERGEVIEVLSQEGKIVRAFATGQLRPGGFEVCMEGIGMTGLLTHHYDENLTHPASSWRFQQEVRPVGLLEEAATRKLISRKSVQIFTLLFQEKLRAGQAFRWARNMGLDAQLCETQVKIRIRDSWDVNKVERLCTALERLCTAFSPSDWERSLA